MRDLETLGRFLALETVLSHILEKLCIDSSSPLATAEETAKWAIETNITMLQVTLEKNMDPAFFAGYSETLDNALENVNDLLNRLGSTVTTKK